MFSPLPDVPAPLFFYGHSGWVVAFGRGRGGGVVCGHGVQRTKCMGRRNPVGRCAWAELEWCNYSRTLPILPSFPYLRAIPYPFHVTHADLFPMQARLPGSERCGERCCVLRRLDLNSCCSTVMWKHSCFEAMLIMRVFTFLC